MRIGLFVAASEQSSFADDVVRAVDLAQRTVVLAEGIHDWLVPDVRVNLYRCLRKAGRDGDAAEVERGLRERLPDGDSFHKMAEVVAITGYLALAEAWYMLGIRYAEKHKRTDDFEFQFMAISRAETRKEAGLPQDDYDLLADVIEATLAEDF